MRLTRLKYDFTGFMLALLVTSVSFAQSYRKDSLQIKTYTRITYINNQAKDIELLKVLCDYCSDLQKKAIGDEALRRSYDDRYNPDNRLVNGQKKLAIVIRVAKKDLKAIKEKSLIDN
ncbi:MAG: hypothetical protein AAF688_08830 [Bacteroidota bacterium]